MSDEADQTAAREEVTDAARTFDFIGNHGNLKQIGKIAMAIKSIYVHRDDILKIHIVDNEKMPATKASYESQIRELKMLVTIRDSKTIGYCDFDMQFRLERTDGSILRYKQ